MQSKSAALCANMLKLYFMGSEDISLALSSKSMLTKSADLFQFINIQLSFCVFKLIQQLQLIQQLIMNSLAIEDQLKLLNNLGYTLNIEERMKLKLAHIRLMNTFQELDEVKFWGKIQGLTKSYYIMLGLKFTKSYEFPHKYFYWASQDFQFKQLPELLIQHEEICQKTNGFFSGDPNKILLNLQGQGQGGQGGQAPPQNAEGGQGAPKKQLDQQEQQLKKVPKKNFTQLNRLSYVIRSIQNDAQVIPQSSYRMTAQNQLRPNNYFYGLNAKNSTDLRHWYHFRAPQTEEGRKKIQSDNVVFSNDFLDNLQKDLPKGVWSLQLNNEQTSVSCRNLSWPGYYAFHKLGTNIFGSAYIGDGIKNIDLAFML